MIVNGRLQTTSSESDLPELVFSRASRQQLVVGLAQGGLSGGQRRRKQRQRTHRKDGEILIVDPGNTAGVNIMFTVTVIWEKPEKHVSYSWTVSLLCVASWTCRPGFDSGSSKYVKITLLSVQCVCVVVNYHVQRFQTTAHVVVTLVGSLFKYVPPCIVRRAGGTQSTNRTESMCCPLQDFERRYIHMSQISTNFSSC